MVAGFIFCGVEEEVTILGFKDKWLQLFIFVGSEEEKSQISSAVSGSALFHPK